MNRSALIYRILLISVVFIIISGMSQHVQAKTIDGVEYFNTGKFEKAAAIFREILKGDAENVQAGYYLGLSLVMQEKYEEALGIFQNLMDSIDNKDVMKNVDMPDKGQLEIVIARTYLGLKKYPEALENLEAAEKDNADPVEIHTYKGAYYLEINENTKANEELQKALELESQNAYTYYYAGIAYLRLGDPAKAVKMLKAFLEMAPFVPEAEHARFLIDTLC